MACGAIGRMKNRISNVNIDELVKSSKALIFVIPVKLVPECLNRGMGIQCF